MTTLWLCFVAAGVLAVFGFFVAGVLVGEKLSYVVVSLGFPVAMLFAVFVPLSLFNAMA